MSTDTNQTSVVDTVVKLGGSILVDTALRDAVTTAIGAVAHEGQLLVVPGGGPFADAVREVDRRFGLSDDAAHWMGVLAMDQSAYLVAERLEHGAVVRTVAEIGDCLRDGEVPVLAPSNWLQKADPLPHSWDVTSDSIAAWAAGRLGARRLVMVKPPGVRPLYGPSRQEKAAESGPGERMQEEVHKVVDGYFQRALPPNLAWTIVPADQVEGLVAALRAPATGGP
jgi:aspartokinase-like uncharacterized kinase